MFNVERLASLSVTVRDSNAVGGESAEKMDAVLISLSGHGGFRKNVPTDAAGQVEFLSLHPGSFFLRPYMKEYLFEPAQLTVEVEEGKHKDVVINAKRVRYSCYGQVNSLNGQPLEGVTVTATAEDDSYEDAVTDAQGQYRLRGLEREKLYQVKVKTGRDHMASATPASRAVQVSEASQRNVDFTGFKHRNAGSIEGLIHGNAEYLSSLTVEVWSGQQFVKRVSVSPTRYFEIHNLPLKEYTLRLHSNLVKSQFQYTTISSDVQLTPSHPSKLVELHFDPVVRSEFDEGSILPFPVLLLFIGAIYCALNQKRVAELMKDPQSLFHSEKRVERADTSSFLPAGMQNTKAKGGVRQRNR